MPATPEATDAPQSAELDISGAPDLYLDLLGKALTRTIFETYEDVVLSAEDRRVFAAHGMKAVKATPVDLAKREVGLDWPADAETMLGVRRLENIRYCATTVLADGIPGDLIETGVWRGGGTIMMRAVLKAFGDTSRTVWVADSFEGLPKPNEELYPADKGDLHHTFSNLAISLEDVQENFRKYGLLDDKVRFLKGWFKDTLPTAPIERLSVLRLDGDMYESTMDALNALYDKLEPGGFCIVDDYGAVKACAQAIEDYRREHSITDPMIQIDWTGVYWRKS